MGSPGEFGEWSESCDNTFEGLEREDKVQWTEKVCTEAVVFTEDGLNGKTKPMKTIKTHLI